MSARFESYDEAARYAAERCRATDYRQDYGIRCQKEFGRNGYNVAPLPRPDRCFGSDLRAERIDETQARMILAMPEKN